MKVEEGVVRLRFQNNWFLPKTRSFFKRIVSAQRTCLYVKPEVLVMNCYGQGYGYGQFKYDYFKYIFLLLFCYCFSREKCPFYNTFIL